mgnify:CR=1 FL=1
MRIVHNSLHEDVAARLRELAPDIDPDQRVNQLSVGQLQLVELAKVLNLEARLVVLDVWLKGSELDGLGILTMLKDMDPFLPVVVISGHGTVETAVEAIRRGAYDYLEKPFKAEKLIVTIQRAMENAALKRENSRLRARSASSHEMVGRSGILAQLTGSIDKVSPTNSRIMISGPPGSGKDLVARLIHEGKMGPAVLVFPERF